MATVKIPDEERTITDQDEVTGYLATLGIRLLAGRDLSSSWRRRSM